ncbi:CPBP family intramembrane glutamic endopeptidase [Mucilaginibacter sp. SG564]|uniref:CPBP family intramembrane glutamic endopeptidase n=1 Tax=Mucilaginibacter sp. SG564 TaxID=2587022 RepID=UPI001555E076|nr:CPBP family intramembrane glutamic endopeptidase [Mucilaginibacter sp. SG564]NOW93936.1 membrane protease YdiL (CAAX protease family) [Mucilaginibacter sp. SG564]
MTANKSKRFLFDVMMIIVLVIFPHLGLMPMYAFAILLLLLIGGYLRLYKEGFSDIGFRFRDISFRSFWLGGSIGLGFAMLMYWLLGPLLTWLGFAPANVSDFYYIRHNAIQLFVLLAIASFLVIPFEEIVYRGFIFTRIRAMTDDSKYSFAISGLITSIIFTLYHYQEGAGAMISIFIGANFVIWLYKIVKGNLWYLIFFHIVYDIFMLTAIYLGYM